MAALFPAYFRWHYTRAYRDAFALWMTFLWFAMHAFRIPLHLRTLFSRFHRLGERYDTEGFDVADMASAFIINTLMRMVGAVMRLIVIFCGLIAWSAVFLGGVVFFAVWTVYPVVIPFCIAFGVVGFVI